MSREKHGCKWTKKDEQILSDMFWAGRQYEEMAKKLSRTWFSCKCRLIKLKLLPYCSEMPEFALVNSIEKYDVPLDHARQKKVTQTNSERTFSNDEIDTIITYFKTRLAKLAIQKLDTQGFQRGIDISVAEDIFTGEINKLKNIKSMSIQEREKFLMKLA